MLEFLSQNWFVSTLLTTFFIGLVAFVNKIFAERKYNQCLAVLVLYGILTIISGFYILIIGWDVLNFSGIVWSILFGIEMSLYSLVMLQALKYLPTSTYFVNVRLLSSFTLLFIGIVFFKDIISISEWIGFVLGVIAITLLFEKDEKSNKNYKKGVLLLLVGAGLLIFGHTVVKVFSSQANIIPTLLFISFLSAFLFSLMIGYKTIVENKKDLPGIIGINFIQAVLFFLYFLLLFRIYNMGDLGISYKIQSYSPFIPIILSAIVYKEKISTKKKIALVLVAISLWFFK